MDQSLFCALPFLFNKWGRLRLSVPLGYKYDATQRSISISYHLAGWTKGHIIHHTQSRMLEKAESSQKFAVKAVNQKWHP